MHRIDIGARILEANDEQAEENRAAFHDAGVFVVNLMSAPGAGKTALLEQTIERVGQRCKIGVIEGDLMTTLDADRIRAMGVPAFQITTGSVCHLDAKMVHTALHTFKLGGLDLLFVENVGNLVCPAEFDLGEDLRVMVWSVVEGAEKPKKYPAMFHTSEVVLLNKIDLIPYAGVSLTELQTNVLDVHPDARIFPISCRTGEGLDRWVTWLLARREEARIGRPTNFSLSGA